MSNKIEKTEKLNVHLKGELADKFKRIKTHLGLENDTEVIRSLITWYYYQHEKELIGPPKTMWKINANDKGVLVWDPELQAAVQIYFKQDRIVCEKCLKSDCKHIQWVVAQEDVQEIIRRKRREGWNLPEI